MKRHMSPEAKQPTFVESLLRMPLNADSGVQVTMAALELGMQSNKGA